MSSVLFRVVVLDVGVKVSLNCRLTNPNVSRSCRATSAASAQAHMWPIQCSVLVSIRTVCIKNSQVTRLGLVTYPSMLVNS
eukprot:5696680-Amphidinium_carterae.1